MSLILFFRIEALVIFMKVLPILSKILLSFCEDDTESLNIISFFYIYSSALKFIDSIDLSQPCAIIGKAEEVLHTKKTQRIDKLYYGRMIKLIWLLSTLLRTTIIHFGCLNSITVVTNVVLEVINK